MSGSLNKCQIIGNLGNDPEIKTFQNGGRVANLSIATSESWKDKSSGERKERVQWHRIVVSSEPLVNLCEKYIKKGSKIYIEGSLENRKYTDKDGIEKYTTEVVLRPYSGSITMLDSKGDSSSQPKDGYDDGMYNKKPAETLDDALGEDSDIPFWPNKTYG